MSLYTLCAKLAIIVAYSEFNVQYKKQRIIDLAVEGATIFLFTAKNETVEVSQRKLEKEILILKGNKKMDIDKALDFITSGELSSLQLKEPVLVLCSER
ncbi:hypothetical protein KKH23_04245 [Patescibacteria group bacterium]|nr:hypothetical protein [Patescibacteria group bacterium]